MTFQELKKHLDTMDEAQLKQLVTFRADDFWDIVLAEDHRGELFFVVDRDVDG